VGGAGAQQELFAAIIERLLPYVRTDQATLLINVGDHRSVWEGLLKSVEGLGTATQTHFDDFAEVAAQKAKELQQEMAAELAKL
jgi:hypothetical protein